MSELPKGWEIKKLSEIASTGLISDGDWVESKDQDPSGAIRLIQLADIGDGNFKDKSSRFMNEEKAALLKCTFLQTGDVLIARMPDPLGRACLFPELGNDCVTVVDICIVRLTPDDLMENRLLKYWLNSPAIRNLVNMQATGTTRRRITKKKLSAFELPVPPRVEQKRISDKLDSLLAKVEAAQARLDKIPAILKRFRQSVLVAATSGELTRDWREEHGVDIDDWKQSTLSEVSICLDPNPSHRYPKADSSGVPILSTQQFVGLDSWTTDKSKLVSRDFFLERREKTKFLEDDIIFARKGRLGLARMAPKGFDYVYSHTVFIVRASGINKEYLLWLLRQDQTVNWLLKEMNSNTGVPTLGKAIFEKLPVPLPCEKEQVAIVGKVNGLFEHAETVEKQYNAAKVRLDKLTQSIFAKAFKGELLPNSIDSDIEKIENSVEALNA